MKRVKKDLGKSAIVSQHVLTPYGDVIQNIGDVVDCLPGRCIVKLDYVGGKEATRGGLLLPESVKDKSDGMMLFEEHPYQGLVVGISKTRQAGNGHRVWVKLGDWVLLREQFGISLSKGYVDKVILFGDLYFVVQEADIICRVPGRDSIATDEIKRGRVGHPEVIDRGGKKDISADREMAVDLPQDSIEDNGDLLREYKGDYSEFVGGKVKDKEIAEDGYGDNELHEDDIRHGQIDDKLKKNIIGDSECTEKTIE